MSQLDQNDYAEPKVYIAPKTQIVKSTALICLTTIIGVGMVLFSLHMNDRFSIIPSQEGGLYVLDRKDANLNHCDSNANCRTIALIHPQMDPITSVCGNIMQSGQVMSGMIGGGMMPMSGQMSPMMNSQMGPQQQMMGPQMMQGQGMMLPQNQGMPGSINPSMILGSGMPKAAPTSVVQGAMQSGQVMVNARPPIAAAAPVMLPPPASTVAPVRMAPPPMAAATPFARPVPVAAPAAAPFARPAPVAAPVAAPSGPLRPAGIGAAGAPAAADDMDDGE